MLALPFANVSAQQPTPEQMESIRPMRPVETPVIYINTGTGINNPTGIIGFSFDLPVAKYVSIESGIGASTWGDKIYLGGKYYLKSNHRGLAFAGGLTRNTGITNLKRDMETTYGVLPVTLQLYSKTNLLLAAYRYYNLGHKHNRFYVGVGWSQYLAGKGWSQTAGHTLTDDSKNRINSMSPGGPVIVAGFSFGFYRR